MVLEAPPFDETFDSLDTDIWYVSSYTNADSYIDTSWSPNNAIIHDEGVLELLLEKESRGGKPYTGAEIQTYDFYGYGRYEVTMQASGEEGVNSSFFTYTGDHLGDDWNEIDIEIYGLDPTKLHVAYHNDGETFEQEIDLGFDASEGMHTYAFEWRPDSVSWYVDGELVLVEEATIAPVPDVEGRIMASIWTGWNSHLGEPTFETSTSAYYDEISFTPFTDIEQPPAPPLIGDFAVQLVNTDTDEIVAYLQDGMTIDRDLFGDANLTVNVIAYDRDLRTSMRTLGFDVTGALEKHKYEQYAPWALFGDPDRETLNGQQMPDGDYQMTLTAYSGWEGKGIVLEEQSFDFTIEPADGILPGEEEPEPDAGFSLLLYDSATREVKAILDDETIVDTAEIADDRSNILVQLDDPALAAATRSLVMTLDGPVSRSIIEGAAPYALFGDAGFTKLRGVTLPEGDYTLTVSAMSAKRGEGSVLAERTIDFSVGHDTSDNDGVTVFLVDAENDHFLTELSDGDVIDLSALPTTELSIVVAADDAATESVSMALSGALEFSRTESVEPYALFGDSNPDFRGQQFVPGDYGLEISTHSRDGGSGSTLASVDWDLAFV
ncbi:family 16 glycosylhydrolase [Acuticoccus sediminis]|nr:family 16 glycosylhydrolase [Acuticoccus sediminis]